MKTLTSGTRMVQSRDNKASSSFTLFNNRLNDELEISFYAAQILRKAQKKGDMDVIKMNPQTEQFYDELKDAGFIQDQISEYELPYHVYLAKNLHSWFPLSAFNIELTNICNLRCQHCYGSFSETAVPQFVPLEWIKDSIKDLNELHTRRIGLTGGEATLHPNFLEIVSLLLINGFELCVFTNGYNTDVIQQLLNDNRGYRFSIKVSVDGCEIVHDAIRGRKNSFANAMKTVDIINQYQNVTMYISTTIMRNNINNIKELDFFIKNNYPRAVHTKDLAFPLGSARDCVFNLNEIELVEKCVPGFFKTKGTHVDSDTENHSSKRFRCTGGISQCTLMPDGNLKICNSACNEQFYFKHNVYNKGLVYSWRHCGKNIEKYRHEKIHRTIDCKVCNYKQICNRNDCRMLAWAYTGSLNKSNPMTCYATKTTNNDAER